MNVSVGGLRGHVGAEEPRRKTAGWPHDRCRLTECEAFLLRLGRKSQAITEALTLVNALSRLQTLNDRSDWDSRIMRVSGHRISIADIAERLWQIAASDGGRRDRRRCPGGSRPAITGRIPMPDYSSARADRCRQRRQKLRRHQAKKIEAPEKEAGQAAGTADHRDLDRAAEAEDLRRQRLVRGKRRSPPA